jgi:hypothetical protein
LTRVKPATNNIRSVLPAVRGKTTNINPIFSEEQLPTIFDKGKTSNQQHPIGFTRSTRKNYQQYPTFSEVRKKAPSGPFLLS